MTGYHVPVFTDTREVIYVWINADMEACQMRRDKPA
jgi:hypothetical protein